MSNSKNILCIQNVHLFWDVEVSEIANNWLFVIRINSSSSEIFVVDFFVSNCRIYQISRDLVTGMVKRTSGLEEFPVEQNGSLRGNMQMSA